MSKEKDKKKASSRTIHVPGTPTQSAKRLSPEDERRLFMSSNHVEWTPFIKSLGLNPRTHAPHPEFRQWAQEKRLIIAREQAETVSETLFQHRANWHQDVLRTLKEYPETADAMMVILKTRANAIIGTIKADQAAAISGAENYKSKFDEIKTSELHTLASAFKTTTELKHKALMIEDWSIKEAALFTDPAQFEPQKVEDQHWNVKLFGQENPMEIPEFQKMIQGWYDNQPVVGEKIVDVTSSELETT